MKSKQAALLAQKACEAKKAEDIVILDIRRLSSIADYFVIASGNSDRHVRAIADHVLEKLEEENLRCTHIEGLQESKWIFLDFDDVIVHVFYPETRRFYNLERLWGEAHSYRDLRPKSRKKKLTRS